MGAGQQSEGYVNKIVQYLLFFFNFLFWLIGCSLIGIGTWAYIEKNRFYHTKANDIYDIIFDISIVIIVIGCIIFVIAFAGCLGAIRENIFLLKCFSYALGIIFVTEAILAILAFVFSGEVKGKVTEVLQEEGIIRYRDDPDFQNIIDWFQETFQCCGVGINGFKDWSLNVYFNCSDQNLSVERCGVPYSCCIIQNNFEEMLINTMCGYDTQTLSYPDAQQVIYTDGCVGAVLRKAEDNLVIIGGVAIGFAIPQILGIVLAYFLIRDIQACRDFTLVNSLATSTPSGSPKAKY